MSSVLELTGEQRLVLMMLSLTALTLVTFTTLKNSVWMFFTGKWFEGKPIRYAGSIASLGFFAAAWSPVRTWAVAVLLLGVAVTDGAILLAEARHRRSRRAARPAAPEARMAVDGAGGRLPDAPSR